MSDRPSLFVNSVLAMLLATVVTVPSLGLAAALGTPDEAAFTSLKNRALRDQDEQEVKSYLTSNRRQIEAVRTQATVKCIQSWKFGPPTFGIVVEVAESGRIVKAAYFPQVPAAQCVAEQIDGADLPKPPRMLSLYWGTGFRSGAKP